VNSEDKEFLELLGYLYLQYGKTDAARVIYHTLCEFWEPTSMHRLTYSYCLAVKGSYSRALYELDQVNVQHFSLQELSSYHLLRGNILWHLKRDREARRELHHFLSLESQRVKRQSRVVGVPMLSAVAKKNGNVEEETASVNLQEGLWRKFLRFIARKELNRELSR
jgi:Flp pilus assembly protein TadD